MSYHSIYATLWLILAAYWVTGYVGNKPTAYRWKPGWRILAIILFIALIVFSLCYPGFNVRVFRPTRTLEWVGIAVCATGVAVAIWARRTLGRRSRMATSS